MNTQIKIYLIISLGILITGCGNLGCSLGLDSCDDPGITANDGSCQFELDDCGVCGGDGSSCVAEEGVWNVLYDISTPIAGFQFDVTGITITASLDGAAEEAGFMVSTSSSTVLGFSLSGAVIPAGSGVLVALRFDGDENFACLTKLVLSDAGGVAIDAEVDLDCRTIINSNL